MTPGVGRLALLAATLAVTAHVASADPPFSGTIFLDPDIITASDPTVFTGIAYTGTGSRLMFDRRVNAFVIYEAFLFNATFSDHAPVEVQINPEFGSPAAAAVEAEKYAKVLGRMPAALRTDVQTMWIHQGVQPFGGGNSNILIHTGQAALYEADGILEETIVHEASHSSLDAYHAFAPAWLAAQVADHEFISTYARDNPTREDIAESFLPYLMVRYRRERIAPTLADTIETTIPHRLAYFDQQAFTLFPMVFTDNTLVGGLSTIRAVHIAELRQLVDGLRARHALAAYDWTDATIVPGVTLVRALHVVEIRLALDAVYAAAGLPGPAYTDPALAAGAVIKVVHIVELRGAVLAIE